MERPGLPERLRHRIGGTAPVAPVLLQLTPVSGPPTTPDSLGSSKPVDGFARQATERLADRVAAVLGVLRSVAGCGAGGSEPGPPSTAPSPPAGPPDAVTIGASLRGRVVIEAAATRPSGLAGIVSVGANAPSRTTATSCPMLRRSSAPRCTSGQRRISPPRVSGSSGSYTMRCGESQTFFSATASPTAWT